MLLMGASLGIWPTAAAAQAAADSLTVAQAVAIARQANPMLRATRLKADAAAERVPRAGAWPDPQLSIALNNRMVGDLGSTMDPMTMNEIQLTQMVPWPGKLGFGKERARRLANAEQLDATEAERMLIARVKSVYYQLAYIDRAVVTMASTRELLRHFLEVTSAMYAVGTGLQQDVLQAQVAIARMTEDITVMRQDRVGMAARFNALLGRPATDPVGALELPEPSRDVPPPDSLMRVAAENRPALRAAGERLRAAQAAYRGARRELYPDLMVSLGYGARPQFDNMATLMLGVSLPLWAGSRQLPMRREMRAMESMAQAELLNLNNETFAELTERMAEAERSRRLSELYANAVLPQARAAVDASLAAYRVGRVNYMTLVDNQMTVNRYEIERVKLAAQYHGAVAEIEALVGAGLGGQP